MIKSGGKRERKNAYKILVGKSEGRKPLGRSGHIWNNNNKLDFREIT